MIGVRSDGPPAGRVSTSSSSWICAATLGRAMWDGRWVA